MLRVYYPAADNRFREIMLSALSLTLNYEEPIAFYILTMPFLDLSLHYRPFSKRHASEIEREIRKRNPKSSLEVVDATEAFEKRFGRPIPELRMRSPYPLLRYLIPDLFPNEKDKALVIDADVVAFSNIAPLVSFDLGDKAMAAPLKRDSKRGHSLYDPVIILFDPSKCGSLFCQAIEDINGRKFYLDDLSFSRLFEKDTAVLPGNLIARKEIGDKTVLKHFSRDARPMVSFLTPLKSTDAKAVARLLGQEKTKAVYEPYIEIMDRREKESQEAAKKRQKEYILEISHLYKTYGKLKAVDDVSFKVKRGALFAFLGLNGAGKSTTINIISSILEKDYGRILIDGKDLDRERTEVKREIGIVFQTSTLDDVLTSYENLSTRAEFYGISGEEKKKRIAKIVEMLELEPLLNRPVKALSGGQRRRLDIARSMIHEPKLLILDEPTTGLDPKTRQSVWHLIDDIREKTGMTVFLTTHYLEEAEKASEVVIMDHGKIIAQGTPNDLKNRYASDFVLAYSERTKDLDALMEQSKGAIYNTDALAYRFPVKDSEEARRFLASHKDLIKDFEVKKGTMDDVFLSVTGIDFNKEKEEGK